MAASVASRGTTSSPTTRQARCQSAELCARMSHLYVPPLHTLGLIVPSLQTPASYLKAVKIPSPAMTASQREWSQGTACAASPTSATQGTTAWPGSWKMFSPRNTAREFVMIRKSVRPTPTMTRVTRRVLSYVFYKGAVTRHLWSLVLVTLATQDQVPALVTRQRSAALQCGPHTWRTGPSSQTMRWSP